MTDSELLEKYKIPVEAFKQFCVEFGGHDSFEEQDFYGLSLGFFIALGITDDLTNFDVEGPAWALARICRYQLQYWC